MLIFPVSSSFLRHTLIDLDYISKSLLVQHPLGREQQCSFSYWMYFWIWSSSLTDLVHILNDFIWLLAFRTLLFSFTAIKCKWELDHTHGPSLTRTYSTWTYSRPRTGFVNYYMRIHLVPQCLDSGVTDLTRRQTTVQRRMGKVNATALIHMFSAHSLGSLWNIPLACQWVPASNCHQRATVLKTAMKTVADTDECIWQSTTDCMLS